MVLAARKLRWLELAVKLVSKFTVGKRKECGRYPRGAVGHTIKG